MAKPISAASGQPSSTSTRQGGNTKKGKKRSWDWKRVKENVGKRVIVRRADKGGTVGFYGEKLYVGSVLKHREIVSGFDETKEE